jgi:hypothetical protein
MQFMIKDSKKYAATGGWGFAQFNGSNTVNVAVPQSCFHCHEPAKDQDFVFPEKRKTRRCFEAVKWCLQKFLKLCPEWSQSFVMLLNERNN